MMKDNGYYQELCTEVTLIREDIVDELVNEQDYERAKNLLYELKAIYVVMQRFSDLNNEKKGANSE